MLRYHRLLPHAAVVVASIAGSPSIAVADTKPIACDEFAGLSIPASVTPLPTGGAQVTSATAQPDAGTGANASANEFARDRRLRRLDCNSQGSIRFGKGSKDRRADRKVWSRADNGLRRDIVWFEPSLVGEMVTGRKNAANARAAQHFTLNGRMPCRTHAEPEIGTALRHARDNLGSGCRLQHDRDLGV
jgi:hypothetical protein